MIKKEGKHWVLRTSSGGRVLGKHPSKAAAEKQERAIHARKAAVKARKRSK